MKPIQIKLKYRLLTKLLISHILLASIPIIITGILLVGTAQRSIEDIVYNRNLEFAKRAAQKISETLYQAKKILKFNATNVLNTQENRLIREVTINNLVNEFEIFNEIYILNKSGEIQISSHYIDDSTRYVGEQFIDQINHGQSFDSEVYISDEMLPFMDFAEPIIQHNEITGILFAEVNLKAMWDVMDSIVVGHQGEGLMFDSKGTYIAHSERKKVYLNEKFPSNKIIDEISAGKFGHKIYNSPDQNKIIASYAPISMKNWAVVIQQPTREAFAQAHTMRLQIIILVITSIIVAWLIAYYFFSNRIVRPVNQLISGIEQLSSGELKYRIPTIGNDEISTLAVQFNIMAKKLLRIQMKLKRTERLETLNKMASILSHEIKNPLNAMVINMQILKNELSKNPLNIDKINDYYSVISSEIERVDKLVNDFLILAKPPKFAKERLKLQNILTEILVEYEGEAQKSNVKIMRQFYPQPIYIVGNKDRIKQAFINIYLNAIQAIKMDGIITISVYIDSSDDISSDSSYAKVLIKDNGEGINKKNINQIFDFYFTTKKEGTGLGLAITQQIIEDHEGTIDVISEKNVGTTFIISLPID